MPTPVPTPRGPRGPYETIAADLRDEIRSSRLKVGDSLPTMVEIAGRYSVAAGTAHRAIAALRTEGLIVVSRGRRAIVAVSTATVQPDEPHPRHIGSI
jgi:DNA-binding GntR family transcriptional regulator